MGKRQFYQGKYIPTNKHKYVGNTIPFYRSSWELRAFRFLDIHPEVLRWNSEGVVVKYVSPKDNKVHRYYVDLWAEFRTRDGRVISKLIEIKPARETKPPRKKKNATRYLQECLTYSVNQAKWAAARQFAADHGTEFIVITEKELGIAK